MTVSFPEAIAATVVVTTCDRLQLLAVAVEALERQTFRSFEILVVENGPERGVRQFCAAKRIRYLHEPHRGLSRARNAGGRAARGEVVAFIDDDSTPQADWLERLVEPFRDPRVGAVTGTIQYMQALGGGRVMSNQVSEQHAARRPARTFGPESRRWFTSAALGGVGDGSWTPYPYTFDGVVKALNDVMTYDWAGFLTKRIKDVAPD